MYMYFQVKESEMSGCVDKDKNNDDDDDDGC